MLSQKVTLELYDHISLQLFCYQDVHTGLASGSMICAASHTGPTPTGTPFWVQFSDVTILKFLIIFAQGVLTFILLGALQFYRQP